MDLSPRSLCSLLDLLGLPRPAVGVHDHWGREAGFGRQLVHSLMLMPSISPISASPTKGSMDIREFGRGASPAGRRGRHFLAMVQE